MGFAALYPSYALLPEARIGAALIAMSDGMCYVPSNAM
jgi:hypothetical protein